MYNFRYTNIFNVRINLNHFRDERALAVGWAKRGFSIWSINGCRLISFPPFFSSICFFDIPYVCTIPQLEGFGPKTSTHSEPQPSPRTAAYFSSELARDGVVTLAWGPNSYLLYSAYFKLY